MAVGAETPRISARPTRHCADAPTAPAQWNVSRSAWLLTPTIRGSWRRRGNINDFNAVSANGPVAFRVRLPRRRLDVFRRPAVRGRTHFVAYPNPTRGTNREYCGQAGNSHIRDDLKQRYSSPGFFDVPPVRYWGISANEARAAEARVLLPLRCVIRKFANDEGARFVDAHFSRSFFNGFCADDQRWIWKRSESGAVQEEGLKGSTLWARQRCMFPQERSTRIPVAPMP